MGHAAAHGVPLSLLTAYMEALDNLLRMLQQVALDKPLRWFDWAAALALGQEALRPSQPDRPEGTLPPGSACAGREPCTSALPQTMNQLPVMVQRRLYQGPLHPKRGVFPLLMNTDVN
jgi:hypothetical protein